MKFTCLSFATSYDMNKNKAVIPHLLEPLSSQYILYADICCAETWVYRPKAGQRPQRWPLRTKFYDQPLSCHRVPFGQSTPAWKHVIGPSCPHPGPQSRHVEIGHC